MSTPPRQREGGLCECAWHCHASEPCPNPRDPRSNVCIECTRVNIHANDAYRRGKAEGAGHPTSTRDLANELRERWMARPAVSTCGMCGLLHQITARVSSSLRPPFYTCLPCFLWNPSVELES